VRCFEFILFVIVEKKKVDKSKSTVLANIHAKTSKTQRATWNIKIKAMARITINLWRSATSHACSATSHRQRPRCLLPWRNQTPCLSHDLARVWDPKAWGTKNLLTSYEKPIQTILLFYFRLYAMDSGRLWTLSLIFRPPPPPR